jgi:hypothetical protein
MGLIGVILVTMSVLACQDVLARDTLTDSEKSVIERAVKNKLKDPDSAKFKWMKLADGAITTSSAIVYCGLVNSKNGYGGYVGYQPFQSVIMFTNKGTLMDDIDIFLRADNEVTLQLCADAGYTDFSEAE